MKAYATAELPDRGELGILKKPSRPVPQPLVPSGADQPLIDQLLGHLADLVVDRLVERSAAAADERPNEWLDARSASDYLGIHRDTLRKLAAQRAIPTHQDGPRCKLYFRRDELDDWRQSSRPLRSRRAQLRAVR